MSQQLFLKDALLPLKESSQSAIADALSDNIDSIKQYLHIERKIEPDLLELLTKSAACENKQLILVCGNVGDGKSHLILYLKEKCPEILNEFEILNDATESSSPELSYLDELRNRLSPFSDENISKGFEKIVIAINLGTLSNFIEDDVNNDFSKFKEFVSKSHILDVSEINDSKFIQNSSFQFVNFCDHNLFFLTEDGPKSVVIESAIERIVSENSPFYSTYEAHKNYFPANCPIVFNFELLRNKYFRERISQLLIECIVRYHLIISVRALYNFIYDLIIPIGLSSLDRESAIKQVESYSDEDFLKLVIPTYLFEHPELSPIFECTRHLDPSAQRSESMDSSIISMRISDDPVKIFIQKVTLQNIFTALITPLKSLVSTNSFVSMVVRISYFCKENSGLEKDDNQYQDFMQLLFSLYCGDTKKLKHVYKLVNSSVFYWHGAAIPGKVNYNLGRQQLNYRITTETSITPAPQFTNFNENSEIHFFQTNYLLCFRLNKTDFGLVITFPLFSMFNKMTKGYRPTQQDHNNFLEFTRFVNEVAEEGEGSKRVTILESNSNRQFLLELDEFGDYCFKEA